MDTWRQRQYIELNQGDTIKFQISKHADQVDVALGQGRDYNSVEQEMDYVLYCIQGLSDKGRARGKGRSIACRCPGRVGTIRRRV